MCWPKEVQSGPLRDPKCGSGLTVPYVAEDTIPPMPTLVPRELSEWMEDRQSDMRETRPDDRRHGSMMSSPPSAAVRFVDAESARPHTQGVL